LEALKELSLKESGSLKEIIHQLNLVNETTK
jgi:hypothetical protein